jgi:hypothetical protein
MPTYILNRASFPVPVCSEANGRRAEQGRGPTLVIILRAPLWAPIAPAAATKAVAVPAVAARPAPGGRGLEAPLAACGFCLHRAHLLGSASRLALAGPGRAAVHRRAKRQHVAGNGRTELAAIVHAGCKRLADRMHAWLGPPREPVAWSAVGGCGVQRRRHLPEKTVHPQRGGLLATFLQ